MSTAVALLQPVPLPSPASPLPNLPAWFERMDKSVRLTTIYDPVKQDVVGDRLTVCALPTPQQRADLKRHKAYLDRLLVLTPINGREHAKKTFGLVAKLMLAKPSRAGGPEAAEARMESYQMALDDVPWWAVAEAIRRWHRGKCHRPLEQAPDYTWAPGTADLRRYAWRVVSEVKKRIEAVDKVLSAEQYDPALDFDEERRRRQKAREDEQTRLLSEPRPVRFGPAVPWLPQADEQAGIKAVAS